MAIPLSQVDKDWQDSPSTSTPIMAADLENISGAVRDYRWVIPSGATSIDEFDDDTVGGSWVQVNPTGAASSHVTWSEGGDTINAVHNASADTGTSVHALLIPLSGFGGSVAVGDGFVSCIQIFGTNQVSQVAAGLILADGTTAGAGNQVVGTTAYTASMGDFTTAPRAFTNFDTQASAGSAGHYTAFGTEVHFRLAQISSNLWRVDASPNGVGWLKGGNVSKTITATHVGLCLTTFGNTAEMVASFNYLRRVSGIS